jgi:hypothetical protein
MNANPARIISLAVLIFCLFAAGSLRAQDANATLSGTVTDPSGKAVGNAQVTVKNSATGQATKVQTDSSGQYKIENLAPGDYDISALAPELGAKVSHVTVAAGSSQKLDLALSAAQAQTTPANNLPNAPSSSKEPSLEDLGFSPAQTQSDAKQQALLDKRTHMLKIHQRMGLITTIPVIAAIFSSAGAGGKSTDSTARDLHVALGALAGDLYGITAYYAIRAPRIPGTETRGPIRVHKALAWVHGPGMILTPILGAMAFDQKSKGERVHGLASAHMPVAIVTAGAFGAALMSVSFKF